MYVHNTYLRLSTFSGESDHDDEDAEDQLNDCARMQEEETRTIYAGGIAARNESATAQCTPCTPSSKAASAYSNGTCSMGTVMQCRCAGAGPKTSSTASISGKRQSDFQLKENAFSVPLMLLNALNCDKSCQHGKRCLQRLSLESIFALRIAFWGEENALPPSSGKRKEQIVDILRDAYCVNEKRFSFAIPDSSAPNGSRPMCQLSFLHAIGLTTKPTLAQAPSQWRRCRDSVLTGIVQPAAKYRVTNKPKYRHAIAYIRFVSDKIAETTPHGGKFIVLACFHTS